jgi:hypothetical protein
MTGQGEITALCRKLERRYSKKAIAERQRAMDKTQVSGLVQDKAARAWELGNDDKSSTIPASVSIVDGKRCPLESLDSILIAF